MSGEDIAIVDKLTKRFAPDAPLIPRADFFGNPAKVAGQLSPDGRWV